MCKHLSPCQVHGGGQVHRTPGGRGQGHHQDRPRPRIPEPPQGEMINNGQELEYY